MSNELVHNALAPDGTPGYAIDPVRPPLYSPVCVLCAHHAGKYRRCAAFTDEIPLEIWNGDNPHTAPYEGDHGLRFQPRAE